MASLDRPSGHRPGSDDGDTHEVWLFSEDDATTVFERIPADEAVPAPYDSLADQPTQSYNGPIMENAHEIVYPADPRLSGVPGYGEDGYPDDRDLAVRRLFAEHNSELVRLAVLLVDDLETAQDVTQDAFLELYKRFDNLNNATAALAYLRSSVLNGARTVLRRRRVFRVKFADLLHRADDTRTAPAADAGALLAEEQREVMAALRRLAPRQREVIVLRYWAGMSEAQVAEQLGVSVGVVKSSASRGRFAIGQMLRGKR